MTNNPLMGTFKLRLQRDVIRSTYHGVTSPLAVHSNFREISEETNYGDVPTIMLHRVPVKWRANVRCVGVLELSPEDAPEV